MIPSQEKEDLKEARLAPTKQGRLAKERKHKWAHAQVTKRPGWRVLEMCIWSWMQIAMDATLWLIYDTRRLSYEVAELCHEVAELWHDVAEIWDVQLGLIMAKAHFVLGFWETIYKLHNLICAS